jgi:uncharacterized membrane protein
MLMWHDTPWMWLSMVVFWSSVAVVVVFAVKAWRRPDHVQAQRPAIDVLEERYARGAISTEEYREARANLQRTAAHPNER